MEKKLDISDLAGSLDHTLLKPDITETQVCQLCDKARRFGFAAVCVPPSYVSLASRLLRETDVAVAAVISFPFGADTTETKAAAVKHAVSEGAVELDIVMNVSAFLSGRHAYVAEELRSLTRGAKEMATEGMVVKIIVETAYLPDEEAKALAVRLVAESGADFVKTSTGFAPGGATVEDVSLLRREAPRGLAVKASGGIRTLNGALAMLDAGATRLGTSGSVEIVQGMQNQQ